MDKTGEHESWDKKKIAIAIFMIILFAGTGLYFFKDNLYGYILAQKYSKSIKGASDAKESISKNFSASSKITSLPIQAVIQEKLDNLKKDISSLSVEDIASSSPQIKKIINDFNLIKDYPVNEAKEICKKICGL